MGLKLPIQVQKSEAFSHWHLISILVNSSALLACTVWVWSGFPWGISYFDIREVPGQEEIQSRPKAGLCLLYLRKSGQRQHGSGHWSNGCPGVMDKRCQIHSIKVTPSFNFSRPQCSDQLNATLLNPAATHGNPLFSKHCFRWLNKI